MEATGHQPKTCPWQCTHVGIVWWEFTLWFIEEDVPTFARRPSANAHVCTFGWCYQSVTTADDNERMYTCTETRKWVTQLEMSFGVEDRRILRTDSHENHHDPDNEDDLMTILFALSCETHCTSNGFVKQKHLQSWHLLLDTRCAHTDSEIMTWRLSVFLYNVMKFNVT